MHALIIGCGYVGRRVARAWVERGDTVAALTRSREHADELRVLGVHPILGDVAADATLASLPAADIVLYAVGLDRSSGKSHREVYVVGLGNVLERIAGTTRRFLYVSSTSVYGQEDGEWVDETSACRPTSPNGQVCLEAEELVWRFFPRSEHSSKSRTVPVRSAPDVRGANILRLAGIYGPGRLAARIESLRTGEPVPGNPDAWLNLIHVEDAVAALLACEERGPIGETYLISDGHPQTRRDYLTELARLIHAPAPTFSPGPACQEGLNKRCSNRRLREELGVEPRALTFCDII